MFMAMCLWVNIFYVLLKLLVLSMFLPDTNTQTWSRIKRIREFVKQTCVSCFSVIAQHIYTTLVSCYIIRTYIIYIYTYIIYIIYIYIHIHIYIYFIYTYVYVYTYIIYIYRYRYTYTYIYIYIHIYIYIKR